MKSDSKNEITIKVKTLNTTTFPININKRSKISDLKTEIFKKVRIHQNNQKLIFQGKVLENDKSLTDYKIEEYDVIHLVETDSRQYQQPTSSNQNSNQNSNSNSNLGEYERLINSIFPSFDDILSSLRTNNNNTNNNNNNNNGNVINDLRNNDEEGIFDSFKHLLKYNTYNYVKATEVLNQNIDNLYNMYNNLIDLNLENSKRIKKLYCLNLNTNFKVGQWIDLRDRFDNWIEGQITEKRDHQIKVQYIGMAINMNEWLDTSSERIAPFRTYTIQKNLKNFFSLYPNKSPEYNREQIHSEQQNLVHVDVKKYEPINNHLIIFMDLIKEKIREILKSKTKLDGGGFDSKEAFLDYERFYSLSLMQIFPLLDRFGRILIDLANFLMYKSYKYFEDNIFNFRKNVYDESLRFMNIHDRRETVNKNRLKVFQTLVQFSCAKIEKDENIENIINNQSNNNNENNNNNRRPLYGIFINRPRELTRQDYINRSRRYMVGREHVSIIQNNKNINKSTKETQTDPIKNKFEIIQEQKKVSCIYIKSSYNKLILKLNENKDNNKDNNKENNKDNSNNNNKDKKNNIENNKDNNKNNNKDNNKDKKDNNDNKEKNENKVKSNEISNKEIKSNNNIKNNNYNNPPAVNKSNALFRSTKSNVIRKEKIEIDAGKKEEKKNQNINVNQSQNLNNLKLHKSVDKNGHLNNRNNKKGTFRIGKLNGKSIAKKK